MNRLGAKTVRPAFELVVMPAALLNVTE